MYPEGLRGAVRERFGEPLPQAAFDGDERPDSVSDDAIN